MRSAALVKEINSMKDFKKTNVNQITNTVQKILFFCKLFFPPTLFLMYY